MLDIIPAAGLSDIWNSFLKDWLTPIYLAMVAIFALKFVKDRQWMQLVAFVGIAAVVGVLVLGGAALFGDENKGLTGAAKNAATEITYAGN